MNSYPPTVFIIDDNAAVRDSLTLLLEQEAIHVQSFNSAEAFLSAYQSDFTGCILLDIRMPGKDGLTLQEELNQRKSQLPIIFLTGYGSIPLSVKAMKAGAIDFLTKPVTCTKLLASIRLAFLEAYKTQHVTEHHQAALSRIATLTEREQEIMALVIQGYSNKEIAQHLHISFRTVEIHRSHILHKTGAHNLLDLLRIAQESGFSASEI